MQKVPAKIGDAIDDVDTPALIIDLDSFEANIRTMAQVGVAGGVRLRPHAKTHKCAEIALRQITAGAVGVCCQKVGEAEALAAAGVTDILVSNQVVGSSKLHRLAQLAKTVTISLCFDDEAQVLETARIAREYGVELGALVELSIGKRCGVGAGAPARDLAQTIAGTSGLHFEGLQAYAGSAQHIYNFAERRKAIDNATQAVRSTLDALAPVGLVCRSICGAGTGTYDFEIESGLWNELQPGSYVFMDTEYAGVERDDTTRLNSIFKHSLFVLATVMSNSGDNWFVVDAGLKSYSGERGPPEVFTSESWAFRTVSDEHGKVEILDGGRRPRLGEKLKLIPGHCDPTVNLHDWFVCVRRGIVEEIWPITARGASA